MMLTELAVTENEAVQNQVERILHSEELRGSEVLRRLLRFLAEKSATGEADELKEYIVAIDGLGKPATYDPRHNSAVRIQVGRLRQKLADYYRGEGRCDPIVIDVPKGRFKLKIEHRNCPTLNAPPTELFPEQPVHTETLVSDQRQKKSLRAWLRNPRLAIPAGVALALAAILALGGYHWLKPASAKANSAAYPPGWDADMEALWHPFISTRRPVIVAIEDPLFVELNGSPGIYYRDRTLNNWNDIVVSPNVAALRKVLKNPVIQPSRYYTAFGEVDASFLIAKLLGPRVQNLSVVKTSDLSLRQIGDNDVLFVGVQNLFFNEQSQATPINVQLLQVSEGIRNLNPGRNEPSLFADQYTTAPTEEGIAYALVTHLPGPLGDNDVESFTSTRAAGYVAAVKAFTDPVVVRTIVGELKQSCGGRMPRYYQVLLKVKFQEQVPTEITYVLGRELH
ncbi:MAG TPA: hypothetical protein VFB43_04650 [Terracidiphilus sp.]|nr:hypothetical protein [Terracidiphilus sp.]